MLVKKAQVSLDVGCPACRFGLSGSLLAAFGADRVWILSTEGDKLVKMETWHHDDVADGRLEDVAVDCENREVTMATCTGRTRRRRLVTQRRSDVGEGQETNGNNSNGTSLSKDGNSVSQSTGKQVVGICQQSASTYAVVQGSRISIRSFNSQKDLGKLRMNAFAN